MKRYAFTLSEYNLVTFFPHNRIKTKLQILEILLEACRYILHYEDLEDDTGAEMVLIIKKMSRIFFISNGKFYSINFPFTFYCDDSSVSMTYRNTVDIDSKTISDVISILKDIRFNSEGILDFAEAIIDYEDQYEYKIWFLIKELLTVEDGYIRSDYDLEGYEAAKAVGKARTHPENHLDIFYSSGNTFKLGLNERINSDHFIDFLDIQTDCIFLNR
jgi:hypothetical protein